MPQCPKALQEGLQKKITRYVTAGWWEMKPVYQAAPLLCMPKKNGKLQTVVDAQKRNDNTYRMSLLFLTKIKSIWMWLYLSIEPRSTCQMHTNRFK